MKDAPVPFLGKERRASERASERAKGVLLYAKADQNESGIAVFIASSCSRPWTIGGSSLHDLCVFLHL